MSCRDALRCILILLLIGYSGGSIPVTLSFADALGVNVLLLPMGRGDDGAHSVRPFFARVKLSPASLVSRLAWSLTLLPLPPALDQ